MGRDTSGMKGMNVSQPGNRVLAMDVASDDQELLVVTENGYGKRTALSDYPRKGRGTMGVKTITLTENKGALAGALVVREHEELVFISARRHGAAHQRARHQPLRPRLPGSAPDEPQGRRHGQRRRAGRGVRRRGG
jgi:DNA gyrase/topoisomerase IV subunit A